MKKKIYKIISTQLLIDETKGVNKKLNKWHVPFESKGFRISYLKTEYLTRNFGTESRRMGSSIEIEVKEVPKCEVFRYLESII